VEARGTPAGTEGLAVGSGEIRLVDLVKARGTSEGAEVLAVGGCEIGEIDPVGALETPAEAGVLAGGECEIKGIAQVTALGAQEGVEMRAAGGCTIEEDRLEGTMSLMIGDGEALEVADRIVALGATEGAGVEARDVLAQRVPTNSVNSVSSCDQEGGWPICSQRADRHS
jgi:hypothetical protein